MLNVIVNWNVISQIEENRSSPDYGRLLHITMEETTFPMLCKTTHEFDPIVQGRIYA